MRISVLGCVSNLKLLEWMFDKWKKRAKIRSWIQGFCHLCELHDCKTYELVVKMEEIQHCLISFSWNQFKHVITHQYQNLFWLKYVKLKKFPWQYSIRNFVWNLSNLIIIDGPIFIDIHPFKIYYTVTLKIRNWFRPTRPN